MRPPKLSLDFRHTKSILIRRSFCTSHRTGSGHSRWSTIKHDKAKADGAKNKLRNFLAKEIELASKRSFTTPINFETPVLTLMTRLWPESRRELSTCCRDRQREEGGFPENLDIRCNSPRSGDIAFGRSTRECPAGSSLSVHRSGH
jgi:hypothetical protein